MCVCVYVCVCVCLCVYVLNAENITDKSYWLFVQYLCFFVFVLSLITYK